MRPRFTGRIFLEKKRDSKGHAHSLYQLKFQKFQAESYLECQSHRPVMEPAMFSPSLARKAFFVFTVDVPFHSGTPKPGRGLVKKIAETKGNGSPETGRRGSAAVPCRGGSRESTDTPRSRR